MVKEALQLLVDIGLLDVILPFMLVFTLTYAILQRTQVLGVEDKKPRKKLNAMVAFVMGFFAVLATSMLNVINTLLAYFVLILIIGLMLALIFGLAGAEGGNKNKLFVAIMIALIALFAFYGLAQAGIIDERRFFNTILWPVVLLGTLALAMYFLLRPEKAAAPTKPAPKPGPTAKAGPAGRGKSVRAEEIPPGGEVEL